MLDKSLFKKQLRKNQTPQEIKLWYHLRSRRFDGLKFRRQFAIGKYIVDFICLEINLIIELDGGQHNISKAITYDNERTQFLEQQGYTVIRYWNNEVDFLLDSVLEDILNKIEQLNHPAVARCRKMYC